MQLKSNRAIPHYRFIQASIRPYSMPFLAVFLEHVPFSTIPDTSPQRVYSEAQKLESSHNQAPTYQPLYGTSIFLFKSIQLLCHYCPTIPNIRAYDGKIQLLCQKIGGAETSTKRLYPPILRGSSPAIICMEYFSIFRNK